MTFMTIEQMANMEDKIVTQGPYEVGLLYRRAFRRACMSLQLEYKEEKGFFDSFFMVTGPKSRIFSLNNWLIKLRKEDECSKKAIQ